MEKTWFSPEGQPGDVEPVKFQIRPLTRAEMWELSDHIVPLNGRVMPNATGRKLLARLGIVDWQGVTDSTGSPVPCPVGNLAAMLEHLPFHLLDRVAIEIYQHTALAEDARKNC